MLNNFNKKNDNKLEQIRALLGPSDNFANVPIAGLVGGEGQLDYNLKSFTVIATAPEFPLLLKEFFGVEDVLDEDKIALLEKIKNIDTVGTGSTGADENCNIEKSGDISINIGGTNEAGKKTEPVVIGMVGSDLSINSGIYNDNSGYEKGANSITRTGNVNINIKSGNVLGGVGAGASVATGNIDIKDIKLKDKDIPFEFSLNGESSTTLNGDVNTVITDSANTAALFSGGAALAIGGKATSTVNGNTSLNINSTVDGTTLEGISLGVTGGGLAVSTLGSEATSTVTGDANIGINNGLAIGVLGGGTAASIDATIVGAKIKGHLVGNDDGTSDINIPEDIGDIGIDLKDKVSFNVVFNKVFEGGTATASIGNSNINLTGNTTSLVTVGGGFAAAAHAYLNRGKDFGSPDDSKVGVPMGTSNATSTAGNTTINIKLTGETDKNILNQGISKTATALKNIKDALSNDNIEANTIIDSLRDATKDLQEQSAAVGVIGGGLALASGDNSDKTEKVSSEATATNTGATINLIDGYIVGSFGGGLAGALNNANATAETQGDIVTKVDKGAEVISAFGNGLAYFTGSSNDGTNNLKGVASVKAQIIFYKFLEKILCNTLWHKLFPRISIYNFII